MAACLVAMGSNLGDRVANLAEGAAWMARHAGIQVVRQSRAAATLPVGGPAGQGEFLNAVALLETSLDPLDLLQVLRDVESRAGRERRTRWAARTLDLDLLLYDQQIIDRPELRVPHPRLAFRRFVLEPAAEVAADWLHPEIGWTLGRLLEHLNVAVNYVALTGPPGVGKSSLARRAAEAASARLVEERDGSEQRDGSEEVRGELSDSLLLDLRVKRLRDGLRGLGGGAAISDFWIGQSLAWAWVRGGDKAMNALRGRWSEVQAETVAPKLLVRLDHREDAAGGDRSCDSPSVREGIRRAVEAVHAGPSLTLDAGSPGTAIVEITAAISAMR